MTEQKGSGGAVGEREELDVERLARSLFMGDPKWHGSWAELLNEDMEIFRDRARDIAASYARLSVNEGGVAGDTKLVSVSLVSDPLPGYGVAPVEPQEPR